MSESTESFKSWAIVEIMGHQKYAGLVTEQAIGGCAFVRVDVPAVASRPAFTKLFGQASIFCITPTTEEIAVKAAGGMSATPINVYGLIGPAKEQSLWDPNDYEDEDD